jgi:serine/threonine protein kinase
MTNTASSGAESSSVLAALCGRFVMLPEKREGGMGTVQKAADLTTGRFAAIKMMKQGGDQERSRTSFAREVEALQRLTHENIVTMLAVDKDPAGRWFLAMEWIDDNLESWLLRNGAMNWNGFWAKIGSPLLSAIEYAQRTQSLVHRDLNPRNVLVTDKGVPKITDYGISKILDDRDAWLPRVGRTLFDARTPGFSPKEPDDRNHSRARDCYSLACIAAFCLVGRKIEDDADLAVAVQEATFPDVVRPLIDDALSDEPRRRPIDARMMLERIQRIEAVRAKTQAEAVCCYVSLPDRSEEVIRTTAELSGRSAVEDFVLSEISESCAVEQKRNSDGEPNPNMLDIIGVSWRFRTIKGGRRGEMLEIVGAYEIEASKAVELRDRAHRPHITFSFGSASDPTSAAENLSELFEDVRRHDKRRDEERRAINSERIFRAWKSYLRDRLDLEANRANAVLFVSRRIDGDDVTFIADATQSADLLGQNRFVRVGARQISGTITKVVLDQVTVRIERGDPTTLPRKGDLLLNTRAAESSLNYQSTALDAVIYGRLPNPRLRAILLDPACAAAPHAVNAGAVSSKLSGEKLTVLRQALGTNEMLAIEGPPGTGKTDLISEIAIGWLRRNPNHRILIASQTHTALDEAIERITSLDGEMSRSIIRIGRNDDPRISTKSRELLLEQKVGIWAERVRQDAEANMTSWAMQHGVDRKTVELGMKVERLVQLLIQRRDVETLIEREQSGADDAEDKLSEGNLSPDESEELDITTTEIGNRISVLKDTLRGLKRQERDVRTQLEHSDDIGPDLARMRDVNELAQWQDLCFDGDDDVQLCRQRLALLETWFLRVGRSGDFNAAVMNSARLVAATCVGVAGTKGVENVQFDLCIVDEASKATATEMLVPLSRSQRWIIVGDPKQLPPFFEDFSDELVHKFDEKHEIRATILDRMIARGTGLPTLSRAALTVQHRMIEPIGNLVSDCFYEKKLQSPIMSHGLKLTPEIPAPITWFTTSREPSREENAINNTFENLLEVNWTRIVLGRLETAAMRHAQSISVAIIAGYSAQVSRLFEMTDRNASDWPSLKVTCNTVDAFQGKQADVCIYSVTLSNRKNKLRFLKERPRLNVALSRARSALIIIGDHHFCMKARGLNPFKPVIDWVENNPKVCHLGSLLR